MKQFWQFFLETLKDKNGNFSGREITVLVAMGLIVVSVVGAMFSLVIPEYMFISLVGMVSAGLGFYTFEKKS